MSTGNGHLGDGHANIEVDLRRRLRPSCRGWGEPEFEALVRRLARMKRRWRDGGAPH